MTDSHDESYNLMDSDMDEPSPFVDKVVVDTPENKVNLQNQIMIEHKQPLI